MAALLKRSRQSNKKAPQRCGAFFVGAAKIDAILPRKTLEESG